jgi:hypothetical protein
MATAAEILNDPNYVNANAATKRAIFERRIATLPEYRNANPATQKQIQTRFGVSAAAKAAPGPEVSGAESAVLGFERGMKPVAEFARKFDPLAYLIDAAGIGAGTRNRIEQQLSAASQQAQQARPNYFAGGKIAGEIAATAPVIAAGGGMLTAAGRGVPIIERIGRAVSSGGIGSGRTAAQTAAMPLRQRQGQLVERAIGGAVAGAGGAALTGQDARTGAEFGAALPAVGSIVRKVAGVLPDLANLPALQAARILRESLGDNLEAARAALSALPADAQELVRQTLVKAGVEPRTFMGLAADVEKLRADQAMGILEGQAAAREARLAQAAGGPTATATRAAADVARRDVSRATGPLRETALGNVKATNVAVSDAERLAAQARAQADEQSGLARRMTFGAERSETRLGQMDDLGDAFDPAAVGRERGIAGAMTQRGEQAARGAIGLRQSARDMDDIVADLAAQGREPLLAAPLVNTLRQQASAEGVRTSSARRALLKLANEIQGSADQNGMLSPYDLYTLRKEASDIVEKYVASSAQPSTGSKKRAAGLVIGFKNAVDEALGPEFKDYLTQHQLGMQKVNMQELGGEAARLAKESPNEFIALMRGERPQIVEDVMGRGTGQYDIYGMALADPNRFKALKQSADELEVLNRMSELSSQGRESAAQLAYRERPSLLMRGLTGAALSMSPPTRIAAQGAEMASTAYMAPRIERQLAEAAVSGPNALTLMNQYPSSLGMSEAVSNLSPGMRNALAQLLRSGTMNYNQ